MHYPTICELSSQFFITCAFYRCLLKERGAAHTGSTHLSWQAGLPSQTFNTFLPSEISFSDKVLIKSLPIRWAIARKKEKQGRKKLTSVTVLFTILGLQSPNLLVFLKHQCCSSIENNRTTSNSIISFWIGAFITMNSMPPRRTLP